MSYFQFLGLHFGFDEKAKTQSKECCGFGEKNSKDPHGLSALIKVTAFKEYQKVIEIQFQNLAKL